MYLFSAPFHKLYASYVNVTAQDDAVNWISEVNWMGEGGNSCFFLTLIMKCFILKEAA